jgi:hypothetical protein
VGGDGEPERGSSIPSDVFGLVTPFTTIVAEWTPAVWLAEHRSVSCFRASPYMRIILERASACKCGSQPGTCLD